MMRIVLCHAAVALLALGTPAAASAQTYVGTWASEPSQCKVGQEMENAPLIMKRNGFDQHEAHCTFSSVRKHGAGWAAKARCLVEGSTQTSNITLTVKGDQLTIGDEAGPRTLKRCP